MEQKTDFLSQDGTGLIGAEMVGIWWGWCAGSGYGA